MGGRGSGGHNRKPTALKRLEGNPGKRKLNDREPIADLGRPEMPPGLSRVARKEWNQIVPRLEQMGVLTVVDGKALAAYCSTYAQWMQAERNIAKYGLVTAIADPDDTGLVVLKTNPAVKIKGDSLRLMRAFLNDFGLTPASRARLTTNDDKGKYAPPQTNDALERFLATANAVGVAGDSGKKPN